MTLLVVGLVLFFGIHLLPWFRSARGVLIARLGGNGYKAAFALTAFAGLALIVWGKAQAPVIALYAPPAWSRPAALLLVFFAFILVSASQMRSNIKRFTRHPMLWGVTLWAAAHLLANGDRASAVLFGAFALYSLFDMAVVNARGGAPVVARHPFTQDLKVVSVGAVAYAIVLVFHANLFGVRVL